MGRIRIHDLIRRSVLLGVGFEVAEAHAILCPLPLPFCLLFVREDVNSQLLLRHLACLPAAVLLTL